MEFTRSNLTNLEKLYNSGEYQSGSPTDSFQPAAVARSSGSSEADEEELFQLLICEPPYPPYTGFKENLSVKLVYGSKKDLNSEYGVTDLPSQGVYIDPEFGKSEYPGQDAVLRFLLLGRKVSQMLVCTWVDQDNIVIPEKTLTEDQKLEIELIKAIFDTYNISPNVIEFVEAEGKKECSKTELKRELERPNYANKSGYLIKSNYASYTTIRLALLFGGQAYYRNSEGKLSKIGASIGFENGIHSTYEIVWKEAFSLCWNSFISTQQDITQAGLNQNGPAVTLTIGYPPRPSEFSLTQERIQSWAFADLSGGAFPFYPEKDTPEWKNGKVGYVVPPHPYLPLSSC